jgi:uncharacterized protein YuzE
MGEKPWSEQKAWFNESMGPVGPHISSCPETRAVYFRIRPGTVAHSESNEAGTVVVDYDAHGRFIGVEILDITEEEWPARTPQEPDR